MYFYRIMIGSIKYMYYIVIVMAQLNFLLFEILYTAFIFNIATAV